MTMRNASVPVHWTSARRLHTTYAIAGPSPRRPRRFRPVRRPAARA